MQILLLYFKRILGVITTTNVGEGVPNWMNVGMPTFRTRTSGRHRRKTAPWYALSTDLGFCMRTCARSQRNDAAATAQSKMGTWQKDNLMNLFFSHWRTLSAILEWRNNPINRPTLTAFASYTLCNGACDHAYPLSVAMRMTEERDAEQIQ